MGINITQSQLEKIGKVQKWKRILIFIVFGSFIGGVVRGGLVALPLFGIKGIGDALSMMFVYGIFAYYSGLIPSIFTGVLSIKFNKLNIMDISLLVLGSAMFTCFFHYFAFGFSPNEWIRESIIPSVVATLILSLMLNKKSKGVGHGNAY